MWDCESGDKVVALIMPIAIGKPSFSFGCLATYLSINDLDVHLGTMALMIGSERPGNPITSYAYIRPRITIYTIISGHIHLAAGANATYTADIVLMARGDPNY